jgi:ABC-2 type transport system ATP-binding protein
MGANGLKHALSIVLCCSVLILAGCKDDGNVVLASADSTGANSGDSETPNNDGSGEDNGDDTSAPTVPVAESRAGRVYDETLTIATNDGGTDDIVLTVMEPAELVAGESYPLILHGHGYGGSRSKTPDAFQQRLRDAGYYLISIDQRGFGESSNTVRVMSPDFEGQDLVGVLDWAENLEGLARRANGKMKVGSYGGSYGGMYQWLLAGADPEERLRVIAPDIAPYDLTYSLDPNEVIKSGWVLALVGVGEAGPLASSLTNLATDPANQVGPLLDEIAAAQPTQQDPVVIEAAVRGALTNRIPDAALNLFRYHSLRFFCENEPARSQDGFTIGVPDPREVAPGGLHQIDALITQGFRDTLFNFNEAANSYDCLKALGGDVRLLTHQSGHILPVSLGTVGLENPLDPFYAALTLPAFQDAGSSQTCGSLDLYDVTFAWFEEKLQADKGAIDAALGIGDKLCLSLDEGDAIATQTIPRGGQSFDLAMNTPAFSGTLGVLGSVLGSATREPLLQTQSLYTTPAGGAVVAGIPQITITVGRLDPVGDLLDEIIVDDPPQDCAIDALALGCDPIYFFALGKRTAGQARWDLIDDQLTPLRGFGNHDLDMTGIAERLSEGDELGLLIYGFHPQYPVSFSRDLLVPASTINGSVQIPILDPQDYETGV